MPRHGNSIPIDRSDEGQADYSGPLLSDFDFGAFSHSALVRMADEVCLQMHLLYLSFAIAVRARAADDAEGRLGVHPRADRPGRAWPPSAFTARWSCPAGSKACCGCSSCIRCSIPRATSWQRWTENRLVVHRSPAHDDGAWISLCSPESVQPLQAIATAVDPHIEVRVSGTSTDWTAELVETDTAATELPEV